MLVAFILGMPSNNSWNGRWSGEAKIYAVVKQFSDAKKNQERNSKILAKGYYSYNFGDGWRASVEVRKVDTNEARKLRRQSAGFCGYEWMIETILEHGEIRCTVRDKNGRRGYQTSGKGEVTWLEPPREAALVTA